LLSVVAHEDIITSAEFSQDARVIASSSADISIKVWDVLTSRMTSKFNDHTLQVN